jgi:hypothetical protein
MQSTRASNKSVIGTPRQRSALTATPSPCARVKSPSIHRSRISDPDLAAKDRSTDHSTRQPLDDLDLIICHEEFTSLVALANKVKRATKMQQSSTSATEYYERNQREIAVSALAPAEVVAAVERMKEQLSDKNHVIRRGMYPLTDAMMDDNFSILQQELEFSETCLRESAKVAKYAPSSSKTSEAIVVKYSKWQTDILMKWIIAHKDNPFATPHNVKMLSEETGLTGPQVVNWMTNVRKRSRKATLDGKKPHHFIDFVFLAQVRDESKGSSKPTPSFPQTPTRRKTLRVQRTATVSPKDSPHPRPIQSSAFSTPTRPAEASTHASPGYYPTPYIPYTPPSQSFPSPYHGWHRTVYSTPRITTGNRGTKRPRGPSDNWHQNLNTVTESFDDPQEDPFAPLDSIDIDLDDDILCVWAANFLGSPDMKGPQPSHTLSSPGAAMLLCQGPIGDVEMTPLEPPTMSPQEIPKTGSFEDDMEWKELNVKSILDEVNIKMEESD